VTNFFEKLEEASTSQAMRSSVWRSYFGVARNTHTHVYSGGAITIRLHGSFEPRKQSDPDRLAKIRKIPLLEKSKKKEKEF
jgi:hypothetical protein